MLGEKLQSAVSKEKKSIFNFEGTFSKYLFNKKNLISIKIFSKKSCSFMYIILLSLSYIKEFLNLSFLCLSGGIGPFQYFFLQNKFLFMKLYKKKTSQRKRLIFFVISCFCFKLKQKKGVWGGEMSYNKKGYKLNDFHLYHQKQLEKFIDIFIFGKK
jgi:hypothetical protein